MRSLGHLIRSISITYSEWDQPLISLEVALAVDESFRYELIVVLPVFRIRHDVKEHRVDQGVLGNEVL